MKMIKTRELINNLLHAERINQIGRPTPDITVKDVANEIHTLEKRYIICRNVLWIIMSINLLAIFLLIKGIK
jgi:hypothetical protein